MANALWPKRLRRRITRHIGLPVLASDVRDIVYASWVVPSAAAAGVVPPSVELVERDGRTILTVLSYRHGHFGPAALGPLRRLFPLPLQSNWRLYAVPTPAWPRATVLFFHNWFDSALYAMGTRLFSDALPSHLPRRFRHACTRDGWYTRIEDAAGETALDLAAAPAADRTLPPEWQPLFDGWASAVAGLTLQDAALAEVPDCAALALAAIDLPIDPASVEPLVATRYHAGPLLRRLGATGTPFCFRVPGVRFRVLSETLLSPRARPGSPRTTG